MHETCVITADCLETLRLQIRNSRAPKSDIEMSLFHLDLLSTDCDFFEKGLYGGMFFLTAEILADIRRVIEDGESQLPVTKETLRLFDGICERYNEVKLQAHGALHSE